MDRNLIYLLHIFVVGPLLAYVGYYGAKTEQVMFNILYSLGIGVILYHMYMYYRIQPSTHNGHNGNNSLYNNNHATV